MWNPLYSGIGKFPAQQQQAHPFPSSDQLKSLEDEKEAIRQEYEAKLATLQAQFNKEQSDKAKLQEEFLKLQQARDEQLAQAQVRLYCCIAWRHQATGNQEKVMHVYEKASSQDENSSQTKYVNDTCKLIVKTGH